MTEITRHFVNEIFIVHKNKVLLHKHKKLDLILPVGGHIERDELPHESAIKEAKEEAGLDIELYNPKAGIELGDDNKELNPGNHLNLHNINPFHQHICFVYYATSKTDKLNPQKGESKKLEWYTKEEIENSTYLKSNVKFYALEALEILGDKK